MPPPNPPHLRKPPSLEDVAQRAGVSTATVSRVLNSPEKVAPPTAERVRQAIAFLDYRPNQFASALMTRSSRVIGLVVPDDFAGMKPEVLAQTEAEARRLGFHLLLVSASRLAETDDTRAAPALGMIDAVAVLIARPAPELHLALQSLGVPMAFLQPHDPAKRQAEPTLQSAAELVRRAMHAVLDPA